MAGCVRWGERVGEPARSIPQCASYLYVAAGEGRSEGRRDSNARRGAHRQSRGHVSARPPLDLEGSRSRAHDRIEDRSHLPIRRQVTADSMLSHHKHYWWSQCVNARAEEDRTRGARESAASTDPLDDPHMPTRARRTRPTRSSAARGWWTRRSREMLVWARPQDGTLACPSRCHSASAWHYCHCGHQAIGSGYYSSPA